MKGLSSCKRNVIKSSPRTSDKTWIKLRYNAEQVINKDTYCMIYMTYEKNDTVSRDDIHLSRGWGQKEEGGEKGKTVY